MRILLAEDQLVIQKVTARQLEKAGYSVDTADNGAEALDACRHSEYDLILMDIMMPVMDGFIATREIRKIVRYKKTPILALTAIDDSDTIQKCYQAGINEVINKWIKKDELFSIINHWNHKLNKTESFTHAG